MTLETTFLKLELNPSFYVEEHSLNIVACWSLISIVKLGGIRIFIEDERIRTKDKADFLGFGAYMDQNNLLEPQLVLESMVKLLEKVEQEDCVGSAVLEKNISKMVNLLGLDSIESDVLRFVLHLNYYDILDAATRTMGDMNAERLFHVLGVLSNHSKEEIRAVFASGGRLSKTGLMSIDRNGTHSLKNKIDIAHNGFVDKMFTCEEDEIEAMIKDSVRRCEQYHLTLNDYDHLSDQLSIMVPYLNNAIVNRQSGVNILLYGQPGTGKTELVKAIAQEIGVELYEVSYADDDDDPIEGFQRLRAYRTAQTLLEKKSIILMFDEIEDVIKDEDVGLFGVQKKQNHKGWLNRMLETNPIPSVWITNNASAIDAAIIRRFDMVLEIPIPPKSKRKAIILSQVGMNIDDITLETIAKNEQIAPALITRAAKVIAQTQMEASSKAFEMIIENTLKAQGHRGLEKHNGSVLPMTYDPSFLSTDQDLRGLVKGIKAHQNARLCLYGAPGTGKSAFGQWISQELDKPFLLKKGSDLMSMWVGGTEKNIANAFKEAREENAVLVFDEVDSFLQDRRSANATWEVTQVNEMLVQMESYEGVFIATTNLMDGLDQAALRRFDMKLEFGYLKPKQALDLFIKEAALMGFEEISISLRKEISTLSALTPGDFAAVRRQGRFCVIDSPQELFERLKDEVAMKNQDASKVMGFIR